MKPCTHCETERFLEHIVQGIKIRHYQTSRGCSNGLDPNAIVYLQDGTGHSISNIISCDDELTNTQHTVLTTHNQGTTHLTDHPVCYQLLVRKVPVPGTELSFYGLPRLAIRASSDEISLQRESERSCRSLSRPECTPKNLLR